MTKLEFHVVRRPPYPFLRESLHHVDKKASRGVLSSAQKGDNVLWKLDTQARIVPKVMRSTSGLV
jgi:hypothetical protein